MVVNNQVKQLIKITILLECKGYFSQHLVPTRYSPGVLRTSLYKQSFVQRAVLKRVKKKGQYEYR